MLNERFGSIGIYREARFLKRCRLRQSNELDGSDQGQWGIYAAGDGHRDGKFGGDEDAEDEDIARGAPRFLRQPSARRKTKQTAQDRCEKVLGYPSRQAPAVR